MLFVWPDSAPNSGRIQSIEASRHRGFESTPLHHPVLQSSDLSENRSKSARVRAICDHAWTQRTHIGCEHRGHGAKFIGLDDALLNVLAFGESLAASAAVPSSCPAHSSQRAACWSGAEHVGIDVVLRGGIGERAHETDQGGQNTAAQRNPKSRGVHSSLRGQSPPRHVPRGLINQPTAARYRLVDQP